MVEAGLNLHGTRSVQKVIEVCRHTPSQVSQALARRQGVARVVTLMA